MTEELYNENEIRKPVKPKKHPLLWQSYLFYSEIMEMRKTHLLRISAIERGMSEMSADFERDWMEAIGLDEIKNRLGKNLARMGNEVGPIWHWLTSIRGLKNGLLTAQLIALIDDIEQSPTIASLWRYCGYAVFDGKAEPKGSFKAPHDEKAGRHYNGMLKGVCFNIAEAFIRMQTPGYVDIYYAEKARQRELHPVAICRECEVECNIKTKKIKGKEVQTYSCPNNSRHRKDFTDYHIHFRAIRKMMKEFLRDLWIEWRRLEGLDISEAWEEKARRTM